MTPPSPAKSDERMSTSRAHMSACVRCRQKKKRCDQQLPRCRLCEIAGVECVGYDAVARKHVPRSYVRKLEERIAYLEARLQHDGDVRTPTTISEGPAASISTPIGQGLEAKPHDLPQDLTPEEANPPDAQKRRLAASAAVGVKSLTRRNPGHEPLFSKLFLTEMMASAQLHQHVPINRETSENISPADIVGSLDDSPISLPPKAVAQRLVQAFFQCASLGMPLLHEPTFEQKLEFLYNMPRTINISETHTSRESRIAAFFVLEVLAIGLLSMHKADPSRIPTWLADRYHETAVAALMEVGVPLNVEGVQALLLIAIYSYHHPTHWAFWKTVGAALRLAVELGLHQDHPSAELDFLTRDTMRRTFWVAYAMDRNISISLTIPSSLSDGAITAKFPSEIDDQFIIAERPPTSDASVSGCKSVSVHLFRYRQIQSEMQQVLNEKPSPPYPPIDLGQWQQQMLERINAWHNSRPRKNNMSIYETGVVDTFEVTFQTAVFYLFRPSLNVPSPSGPQLEAMTHAATNMIHLYERFFRSRQLTIYWQAMQNLYSAGTCLLFGYVHSYEVQNSLPLHSLESLVRTCSSVLWGMAERFPSFQGKRDAFDKTASKVLADLAMAAEPPSTDPVLMQDDVQPIDHPQGAGPPLLPEVLSPLSSTSMPDSLQNSYPQLSAFMGMDGPLIPFPFQKFDDGSINWEGTWGSEGQFTPVCVL